MSKTVAQVVKEYQNRHSKPKYARIGVLNAANKYFIFPNPTNIKEHFENNGLLEFDSISDTQTEHIEMHRGIVIDKYTKLE